MIEFFFVCLQSSIFAFFAWLGFVAVFLARESKFTAAVIIQSLIFITHAEREKSQMKKKETSELHEPERQRERVRELND